ncbi:MAG: hypothetical protein Fur0040_08060 [Sideroxydans sp.]
MFLRSLLLLLSVWMLGGCATWQAVQGPTSSRKVVGGIKQDAKAAGDTVERAAREIGDAINSSVK